MGFLSHQQDWYGSVTAWGSAFLHSPQVAFAAWRARQQLPTLTLDLGFNDYQLLASARTQALRQGVSIPSVEQVVTANGILPGSGESRPVELRLPGGSALGEPEGAWSLELRLKGSNAWQRLIPVTDALSAWQQWGYLETLRQNGFAAAELELLNLTVNGASWGLYVLETPATAALTVGFDARPAWRVLAQGQILPDGGFRYATPAVSDAANLAAPEAYARFRAVVEGRRALSSVTDAEAWGRLLAMTFLWTGVPAPDWSTLRWSPDPETGQLEVLGSLQPATISPLPATLFADPAVQTATARALAEFSQPTYLETLRQSLGEELDLQWRVLGGASVGLADPWSALVSHQRAMRAYLAPERPLVANLEPSGDDFILRLTNVQPFPVQVTGMDVGGAARRTLELSWVKPEDRGALLENDAGAFVLRGLGGSGSQPLEVQLPRELLFPGGELVLLCKVWDAPVPEGRLRVLETLPLLEE